LGITLLEEPELKLGPTYYVHLFGRTYTYSSRNATIGSTRVARRAGT
jgi:hypothetical protein